MNERRGVAGLVLSVTAVITVAIAAFFLRRDDPPEPPQLVRQARQLQQDGQWCEARDVWRKVAKKFGDSPGATSWQAEAKKNIAVLEERCDPSQPRKVPEVVQQARQLHQEGQWCEARDMWQRVADEFADSPEGAAWNSEAVENLAILEDLCDPPEPPVPAGEPVEVPSPVVAERPAPLSEQELLTTYPEGRSVRGFSETLITGQGSHRDWGLQGQCWFDYRAQVAVEVTVQANDGRELTCLVHYPEVSQNLLASRKTLELAGPEMPLLSTLWKNYEHLLEHIPVYVALRGVVTLHEIVDPRLRRTLTWLVNRYDFQPGDQFGGVAHLDKLAGRSFRMKYRSGVGVTWIKDLDSGLFTQDELIRIAYSSSLLMDRYLLPTAEKQIGDEWTVRVQDVAGLLQLDGMTRATGELRLRREESPAEDPLWTLGVRGGEVDVAVLQPGVEQEGQADIRSGIIRYDIDRQVVRDAELNLEANTLWKTRDHLLFGTEDLKDVSIRAYYRGERTDASGTDAPEPAAPNAEVSP